MLLELEEATMDVVTEIHEEFSLKEDGGRKTMNLRVAMTRRIFLLNNFSFLFDKKVFYL